LKARYNELLKLQQEDNNIKLEDMNKIKVTPLSPSDEPAELAHDLKSSNKSSL
jgi:hypothetical protein